MKQPEYLEGSKAVKNFEEGMNALLNVPKDEVVRAQRKAKKRKKGFPRPERTETAS